MSKKILIIEDELDVREDIKELLQLENYTALTASNGLEGIALAHEHLPDLIICDIMMPGIDGFEVLNRLQQNDSTKLIPFMFLTARATINDLRQGMDLGADDYLTKPFTLEELLVAVQTRLSKEEVRQHANNARLDNLRNTLAYSLPHELRTPLVSILGYAEILMMDSTDPFVQSAASTINEAGKRLHHLIENYLLYAHLAVLKNQPEKVIFFDGNSLDNPNLLIESQAETIAEKYQRTQDLSFDLQPTQQVKINDDNLIKIITELVDNAFKFSKMGDNVHIASALQQNKLTLRIQDQGQGFQPQDIPNIGAYQQFNRALHEQQGSGLGLTIAKILAELHAGTLTITSQVDKGTTVHLTLPVVEMP